MPDRLYLDNAATSFPKPPCVLEAMTRYATGCGAPGRGLYAEARHAAGLIADARVNIARLIAAGRPERVVFGYNTTDGLNLAIHGVVSQRLRTQPNKPIHLVTTVMDHNSVLRAFNALIAAHPGQVTQTRVDADPQTGRVAPSAVCHALRDDTVLVAINHASNVTGVLQEVASIGALCRLNNVLFLLDAAQSLGHSPVDVEALSVDLLAFPGHKGLLGPTGTGGLYIRPGVEALVDPVRQGGTGTRSELDVQPSFMPDRYEPGSHNTIGLAGLAAAVGWILDHGVASLRNHELGLIRQTLDAAAAGELGLGWQLLGPTEPEGRVGVFSFVHDSLPATRIAELLEHEHGILSRPGLHCAPLAHRALTDGAGALRLSVGPFVTQADIVRVLEALRTIGASARRGVAAVVAS